MTVAMLRDTCARGNEDEEEEKKKWNGAKAGTFRRKPGRRPRTHTQLELGVAAVAVRQRALRLHHALMAFLLLSLSHYILFFSSMTETLVHVHVCVCVCVCVSVEAMFSRTSERLVASACLACTPCLHNSTGSSSAGGGYKYFEDFYPKQAPAPRFTTYEEQLMGATVKSHEPKKQVTESEKLHHLHNWRKDREGFTPPPEYGWPDEWGPEPGEEGHSEWYKKNRMYMSYEEKSKYDLRTGVPVEKNSMRHQEMPFQKRMKAAYHNLEARDPQYVDPRQRGYWSNYSYEDQKDTMAKARDDYMKEWLDKPGVTKENVALEIGKYNGTAKQQHVKSVQRRPEWELAPLDDDDD